jgi:hypothetical protein
MTDKFNNLSDEALADEIGELNAIIKGHEDRLDALKDAFKDRARSIVKGQSWIVSASTSTSKRLDVRKVREVLGDALDDSYFNISETTRITTKPVKEIE